MYLIRIMNFIEFNDVSFTYPFIEGDLDAQGNQIVPKPVFDHFSGSIPAGFTSLIGPNGAGKSTFMMLASGRILPDNGYIKLFDQNIAALDEEHKNLIASVIYQNMEFESEDKVKDLLAYVYQNGALKGKAKAIYSDTDLFDEIIEKFELTKVLEHGLTQLSKGEIQRVLIAFSLLYGSLSVFMDEPLFAMEQYQKEYSLQYLKDFSHKTGTAVFISMHELDLTKRFADNVLLFYPNRDMDYGTVEEVVTDEALEKAYGIPAAMLKNKESMTREELTNYSKLMNPDLQ